MITCHETLNNVSKIFNWMSKNLDANEKHFKTLILHPSTNENQLERIIQDDTFKDITFDTFYGWNINKMASNSFNITANKIGQFSCHECTLTNQLNYNIFNVIHQLHKLDNLFLTLNITEVPTNALFNCSNISFVYLKSQQELVIKSNAFHNLNKLGLLWINDTSIKRIENYAFKFPAKTVIFENCNLTGETLQNGTFNGLKGYNSTISFDNSTIDYIAEESFKSVLDNKNIEILINYLVIKDCFNCKNYWLFKEKREKQFSDSFSMKCKSEAGLTPFFSQEIQNKLSQKCN